MKIWGHDETCKYFTQWNHKKKGVFVVTVDLHLLSSQLLERLANAIYERDPENPTPFFFNGNELKITQDFLETLLKEKAAWD